MMKNNLYPFTLTIVGMESLPHNPLFGCRVVNPCASFARHGRFSVNGLSLRDQYVCSGPGKEPASTSAR
jgi:hypothetical protein